MTFLRDTLVWATAYLPYFVNFVSSKISNSLHSLYVRVKNCVMTYLNVEGQGQIDISKIAIFSICY